jgi:uncharacterized Zn-finger protein
MAREVVLHFVPAGSSEPAAHRCPMIFTPVEARVMVDPVGHAKCPYCGRRLDLGLLGARGGAPPERISRPSLP